MAVENSFILTAEQRTTAMALNGPTAEIDPRAVDAVAPGVGINLNDLATGIAAGAPVALTGMFVAPKRIMDDPAYTQGTPDLVEYLADKPYALLEAESIFAPPPEV